MTVKVKDVNRTKNLVNELNKIMNRRIKIGIFSESGSDVLIIASVNEFGVSIKVTEKMRRYLHANGLHLRNSTNNIKIPERAFIRRGYDRRKANILKFAESRIIDVYNFRISGEQYLNGLGEYVTGQIRDFLTRMRTPPNHPYTIEKKGSSNPLINTGRLRESITFKIE